MFVAGLALAVLLAQSVRSAAQLEPVLPHGVQPGFVVDHASFRDIAVGKCRLEVYYQIFNFGLQFVKDSGSYLAEYTLTATIDDDDGRRVKSLEQDKNIRVQDYERTVSRFDYRSSQINLVVDPGKYRVSLALADKRSSSVFRNEFKVDVKRESDQIPRMSDIQFVQAANSVDSAPAGVFRKANLDIVPSVSRSFGGTDSSRLLYYLELYQGPDSGQDVVVETIIRNNSKGMLYRDTLYVRLDSTIVRQLRNVAVGEMAPGDYDLEVYLRGRRMKRLDQRIEPFTIAWSQEGLLKHDFKAALDQLAYIAPGSDVNKIKKLKTLEERIAAFNQFWLDRDPTAGTPENEVKREFYRRVNYANRVFHHLRKDGWRTDRGRIYIVYGEPDQIDDYPMSSNLPPYQIWHYYKEGAYKRFAFVDENEDGDYRLQYPYDGLNQRPDF
jgi:GWxTD domain-containing protein